LNANKRQSLVSAAPLDPTQYLFEYSTIDDDNITIATSNDSSCPAIPKRAYFAQRIRPIEINDAHGIADMGATSVFVKDGVPVANKRLATHPLTVKLSNRHKVQSTHTCDMGVPGLPHPLVGHIIPNLAILLLFGICPLCNAGCIVVFNKYECNVWYEGKIILMEPQNKSTELWTLPFVAQEQHMPLTAAPPVPSHSALLNPSITLFTHSIRTRVNAVKFAHQSMGNPCIFTLLKAI
jgi:hypothetical protein